MIIQLAHWPLPWYEIWFPFNWGTAPAFFLLIGWITGLVLFARRPALRVLILHFNILALLGFVGAMIWSLTTGILDSLEAMHGVDPAGRNDAPIFFLFAGGQQTAGLLMIFGIMWAVTNALWIAERYQPMKREVETATPEQPPDQT